MVMSSNTSKKDISVRVSNLEIRLKDLEAEIRNLAKIVAMLQQEEALVYDIDGAARALGISVPTFRSHLYETGRIKSQKVGGRVLIAKSEVVKFLEEGNE